MRVIINKYQLLQIPSTPASLRFSVIGVVLVLRDQPDMTIRKRGDWTIPNPDREVVKKRSNIG
ncbi:MAG: hypothetical protein J0I90_04780 [Nitrosospira sp.]|nr:hypothetical protein [Nitrosospira sp.]